jgi:hypothetical protein
MLIHHLWEGSERKSYSPTKINTMGTLARVKRWRASDEEAKERKNSNEVKGRI